MDRSAKAAEAARILFPARLIGMNFHLRHIRRSKQWVIQYLKKWRRQLEEGGE